MSDPILECRPKLSIVPLHTKEPQSRVGLIFDPKTKKGILEWPVGPEGDKGPRGPSARPWRLVGYVTSAASLPSGLTPDDAGKAWANTATKAVHVWQGYRWHPPVPTGLSRPGDAGPPVDLRVGTVDTLPVGSSFTADIDGEAPNRVLSVGIARGAVGDKGLTRTRPQLTAATDYIGRAPTRGESLSWAPAQDGRPAGWVTQRPGGLLAQWSITGAEFSTLILSGNRNTSSPNDVVTGNEFVAVTIELAPLDVPYRLICEGTVKFMQGKTTSGASVPTTHASTLRVNVTVDDGSSAGQVLIGTGRTDRLNTDPQFNLAFEDRVIVMPTSTTRLGPTSPEGVIQPGVSPKIRVSGVRTSNFWWDPATLMNDAGTDIQLMGLAI